MNKQIFAITAVNNGFLAMKVCSTLILYARKANVGMVALVIFNHANYVVTNTLALHRAETIKCLRLIGAIVAVGVRFLWSACGRHRYFGQEAPVFWSANEVIVYSYCFQTVNSFLWRLLTLSKKLRTGKEKPSRHRCGSAEASMIRSDRYLEQHPHSLASPL